MSSGGAALLICSLFVFPPVVHADPTGNAKPKPASEWTLDERLDARFDAQALAERQHAQAELAHTMAGQGTLDPAEDVAILNSHSDNISGRDSPYLFVPTELFDLLLLSGFPMRGQRPLMERSTIDERAAALGFGANFWTRLEHSAGTYIAVRNTPAPRAVFSLLQDAPLDSPQRIECQVRYRALQAAMREFGAKAFTRFLYEAVAPEVSISYVVHPGMEEHLRLREEGCE